MTPSTPTDRHSDHDHPARWWHREGTRIRCELCPRRCLVSPGQRAFCFVRMGTEEGMVLTTYGRSSGFCIDPIEKKPLNHFLPGSAVLSLGTAGCNLGCRFCQNWDISTSRAQDRLADQATPERIADAAVEHGCASVAFTYNDPIIFAEYAIDTAAACRARGVRTVAVTNGYIGEVARAEFFAAMDAVNIDLKAFSEGFYRKLCLAELAPVLETIEYVVRETDTWVELTTLIIPGANDEPEELRALCTWVLEHLGPDVPLHFTAFHPDYKMLDRPCTPARTLTWARERALAMGLRYVYTGNVVDDVGGSTWCPGCRALLIQRRGYHIGAYGLDPDGRCATCGAAVPGHFGPRPGRWGNRRLPVRLAMPARPAEPVR
ncbi:AmmeMemoRadiSam system radical SAM enzyme [Haliangium sp.]|uniref:AmmeMemoRadiSam system radical SAM enzyme n=1 Tax=Haliangium sp. TaxID=2663208 RepID=UPI003D0FB794